MLMVISPAKTLDFDSPLATRRFTQPALLDDSQKLIEIARQLTPAQIGSLMSISDKLAELNANRFNDWHPPFTPENARQAILAFKGDVYTGLQAETFSEKEFDFAQQHLRMLSDLYGLLRPLDLMQPYRLEMGIRLDNPAGKDLYAFWGDRLTEALNAALAEQGDDVLINLASDEYFITFASASGWPGRSNASGLVSRAEPCRSRERLIPFIAIATSLVLSSASCQTPG